MSNDAERDAALLRLGKRLVEELSLEDGTDTLSRWMAHDIAELIYDAESADKADAPAARALCRDAILALWKHRAGASERLAHIGTLRGWTHFLRSRDNPFLNYDVNELSASGGMSQAELYFHFASTLRDGTAPMVRTALYLAAQTSDPAVEMDASTVALANLEIEESRVARFLINWSKRQVDRIGEMKDEVEKAIAQLNDCAGFLLAALEQLSVEAEDTDSPDK